MDRTLRIGIACGGTGGHMFPGLATAGVLNARGHDVTLWVSGKSVENTVLRECGCAVERVHASGLQGGPARKIASCLGLLRAMWCCRRKIRKDSYDVLLGMGSYASIGPVMAARTRGIPVVLHEANAVPGRAVAWLSRFATTVAVNFEAAAEALGHPHWIRTGMPVRSGLTSAAPLFETDVDVLTVLVMGGSQGAHRVNELACDALCGMSAAGKALRVIHLTGDADEQWVRDAYAAAGVAAKVFPFLHDIGTALAAADLAIARSGAATCAELALCGVPAILIPLPSAIHDHQTANARALAAEGGAQVAEERSLTSDALRTYIEAVCDRGSLQTMGAAMRRVATEDAAERLADVIEEAGGIS